MNKIKQNKVTFILILSSIVIIFSSLTILSLPVLFNYKSKVTNIEKNFYNNFKIYLNSTGKISYKPFPKPHLLIENASLNLSKLQKNKDLINTSNLKIFLSLRNIYLHDFKKLISTEISDTNLDLKMSDIRDFRNHLYLKVNKPINFKNCKIFIKNKNDDVIIISTIKEISYKIKNKVKTKYFIVNGQVFGLNFKSEWKRSYETPKSSFHNVDIFNPKIEMKNIFVFENKKNFKGNSKINYLQEKLEYEFIFNNNEILISSPNYKKTNFNLESKISLNPFYFDGIFTIKNKKIEKIIDNILLNLFLYDEEYLSNFNGKLKIKFNSLNNKLIKNGSLEFLFNQKKINLINANFFLNQIGNINSDIYFVKDEGEIKFISTNELKIENHIEFAKAFQIGSNKVKNIKQINFNLEKNVEDTNYVINNVKINNKEIENKLDKPFLIKNIQNLRSYIRNVIN